jgi:hypothetical protein
LWILAALIFITVAVRAPGAYSRSIWYDEAITLLETAGNAVPQWSEDPTPAGTQKKFLVGSPSFREIAQGLRLTDVHPPMYYVLLSKWRLVSGGSIEAARFFSVLWSTLAVVLLYLLVRISGFSYPYLPSLVYSLSSGAVHYGHEARNYSMAMCLVLAAAFFSYAAINIDLVNRRKFWIYSLLFALCSGLAFQTNYLTVFPTIILFLWFAVWVPRGRRLSMLAVAFVSLAISLAWLGTLSEQIGARPGQFRKALGLVQEFQKIVEFNFAMLWNPVFESSGIFAAAIVVITALALTSFLYLKSSWQSTDIRFLTMILGLALAPSVGLLALDLVFSKSLGKSSYVFFAGPAIAVILTFAASHRPNLEAGDQGRSASLAKQCSGYLLALFIGIQLTGINFDLERTPGFAGSTARTTAQRIESSPSRPVAVVGAGHGRGWPACMAYELRSDTMMAVVTKDTDLVVLRAALSEFDVIWVISSEGRKSAKIEDSLLADLTEIDGYVATSRVKKAIQLEKRR